MDAKFCSLLIGKYGRPDARIYITDSNTRIMASTEEERIGTLGHTAEYVLQIQKPASIERSGRNESSGEEKAGTTFGTPVRNGEDVWGTVVVTAPDPLPVQIGASIKIALESALALESYQEKNSSGAQDEINRVSAIMLSEHVDFDILLPLMRRHDLEPNLLRTVICIRLDYHKNSYFNINLNLGYQSSIEQLRKDIVKRVRHSRYLNSQDLVYMFDQSTLLIIKSFQPTEDLSRIYLALDIVCEDIAKMLEQFTALAFSVSYGNLYPKIEMLFKSWQEAEKTVMLGKRSGRPGPFFNLDMLLFETVCYSLQPQIVNKLLEPLFQKLYRRDGSLREELLDCCEAFVDNCMSFSKTSAAMQQHRNTISARLSKLKDLTGLDPANNFNDAFLVKMLAVYSKQKRSRKWAESKKTDWTAEARAK